jgi:hypothetical protein
VFLIDCDLKWRYSRHFDEELYMRNIKIQQEPLPDTIDPVWLEALRARGAERRRVEEMVEAIMGMDRPQPKMSFEAYLMTFPKIDCDDAIFERHPERRNPDVSG